MISYIHLSWNYWRQHFYGPNCRGFVDFPRFFQLSVAGVFAKYCKALRNIRVHIVFITRGVRLPSSATCLCTKSRLLPNDGRSVSCLANDHRPRRVFRYNRRSFKTHSNTTGVYKNVFDKSNWCFFCFFCFYASRNDNRRAARTLAAIVIWLHSLVAVRVISNRIYVINYTAYV